MTVADVGGNGYAGYDVITRTLERGAKHDKGVKMIVGDERLALVVQHPRSPRQLVGLALNGDGAARCGVGSQDVYAMVVAE